MLACMFGQPQWLAERAERSGELQSRLNFSRTNKPNITLLDFESPEKLSLGLILAFLLS